MLFGTIKSVATATLILSLTCAAHAVLVTDAALVNTSQIRSETNNPIFTGINPTQQVAGLNLYYLGEGGFVTGTLNGIGFHNLNLNGPASGTGVVLSNAAAGVTLDYNFASAGASRNLTTTIIGPDAAVANTITAGNRYLSAPTEHSPNVVTFHGLTGGAAVYVQLIGGEHSWGGTMKIWANGDGINPATGVLEVSDWTSNRTDSSHAGLLGFLTTAQLNGDLTLGFDSNSYTGLSAVILQQQLLIPEPSTLALLGLGGIGLALKARRRRRAVG